MFDIVNYKVWISAFAADTYTNMFDRAQYHFVNIKQDWR